MRLSMQDPEIYVITNSLSTNPVVQRRVALIKSTVTLLADRLLPTYYARAVQLFLGDDRPAIWFDVHSDICAEVKRACHLFKHDLMNLVEKRVEKYAEIPLP